MSERVPIWRRRFVTAFRILNVRLRFVLLMVLTGLVAAQWDGITARWERWFRPKESERSAGAEAQIEYYCPMHPNIVRAEPGNCPICGMPLSKREKGAKAELPEGVIGRVQISPYRMELAGIATSEVGYRPIAPEIRAAGTIEIDERRIARIAARVAGRIEKLEVDFTGEQVTRGQALAEIYSPDLVSTQQEYLAALSMAERMRGGSSPQAAEDARAVVEAARERLRLWGIDEAQIAELEASREPKLRVTIRSPIGGIVTEKMVVAGQYVEEGTELYTVTDLSQVWMTAHVPESGIDQVSNGQDVEIRSAALPGESFAGTVRFVWPVLDRETRTLRVRADVPNPGHRLRPGMYVEAILRGGGATRAGRAPLSASASPEAAARYTCPMHPQVVSDRPGTCPICGMILVKQEVPPGGATLAVPESAVIQTGTRNIVYVERSPGIFDAVEVQLGTPTDGYYPVLSGLTAGERVVTRGAFLVDAEIRLNPAAAGSYFGASGRSSSNGRPAPGGDHNH